MTNHSTHRLIDSSDTITFLPDMIILLIFQGILYLAH